MNPETPITNALWERLSLQGWTRGLLPVSPIMDSHEQLERELFACRDWSSKLADVADDLRAELAAERELADRLADAVTDLRQLLRAHGQGCGTGREALAAWKEARK